MKRLLSYAISVSVDESRSAMVSGQEPKRPSAAISILQHFLPHQCEEAAEHVAADGLVELAHPPQEGCEFPGLRHGSPLTTRQTSTIAHWPV